MAMSEEKAEEKAEMYVNEVGVPSKYREKAKTMVQKIMTHDAFGNPEYEWSLDDFELGQRIGRGKFGRVFSARERHTGYVVALKTLNKYEVAQNGVERLILREIEIQTHLKHPNILQLLAWFHDDYRIYLVLDYAGKGELYKSLKNSPGGFFSEHLSAKYTYQVADALQYCHRNCVIHRDIKPENLLLTSQGDVKLADFGWSVHAPSLKRKTMCGTLDYLAPEMVDRREYSHYVDLWCLGVLCYEFLCGVAPFESDKTEETYAKIRAANIVFPPHVPKGGINLIQRLVVYKEEKRLSLANVMTHEWIVANKDQGTT